MQRRRDIALQLLASASGGLLVGGALQQSWVRSGADHGWTALSSAALISGAILAPRLQSARSLPWAAGATLALLLAEWLAPGAAAALARAGLHPTAADLALVICQTILLLPLLGLALPSLDRPLRLSGPFWALGAAAALWMEWPAALGAPPLLCAAYLRPGSPPAPEATSAPRPELPALLALLAWGPLVMEGASLASTQALPGPQGPVLLLLGLALGLLLPARPSWRGALGPPIALALGLSAWAASAMTLLLPWLAAGLTGEEALHLLRLPHLLLGLVAGAGLALLGPLGAPGTLALAAGLIFAALNRFGLPLHWLGMGAAALLALLASQRRLQLLSGLAIALLAGLAWYRPPADPEALHRGLGRLSRGAGQREQEARATAGTEIVARRRSTMGAWTLRAPSAAREARLKGPRAWPLILEAEGLVTESRGRAAEAELFAGHLAGLLTSGPARALVLGDDLGRVSIAAADWPDLSLDVLLPEAELLRAVAGLDPAARAAWMRPGSRLREGRSSSLLRASPQSELIIEVVRAPWGDSRRSPWRGAHLQDVARRLTEGGRYIAVLHLGTWSGPDMQAALRHFAGVFPTAQLWLPPSGADSLILIGGDTQPSLAALLERGGELPSGLRALELPTAPLLSGLAVGDRSSMLRWVGGAEPRTQPQPRLFPAPLLHLASFAPFVARPSEIWELSGAETQQAALQQRLEGRRIFLQLLERASAGDMQAVFSASQALLAASPDPAEASAALDALIEPQMITGAQALERARREGRGSPAWEEASRLATTARMFSPRSPGPLLLLGEIALASGNLSQARDSYSAAAALDPQLAEAGWGLARVARARQDPASAQEALEKVSRDHPADWRAWQNLGVFFLEQGRRAEAEAALEKASALSEGRQPAPAQAMAELWLEASQPSRALPYAERAVVVGGSAYARFLRGRAFFDLGQLDLAEADFRAAVIEDPRLLEARGAIGQIRAIQGDLDAAAEAFRAVLAVDPTNIAARENLNRAEAARQQGASPPLPPPGKP